MKIKFDDKVFFTFYQVKSMKWLSIILFTFIPYILLANLLPDYDKNCDYMIINKCPIEVILNYEKKQVPRKIHRIWFGDQSKLTEKNRNAWEFYCLAHNIEYKLWTEKNEFEFINILNSDNYELFKKCIKEKNWCAASDIIRIEILNNYGGIYIDCDFNPPQFNNKSIDIFTVINRNEFTIMCEHNGRNVGSNMAIFAGNSFIASPDHHPFLQYYISQIFNNCEKWGENNLSLNAMYCTGPFVLNKILNGYFGVIPVSFLEQLKMFD